MGFFKFVINGAEIKPYRIWLFMFYYVLLFALSGAVNTKPMFEVTEELLQSHFGILYTELEPREIADLMFQDGHITIKHHSDVTACKKKHKRLRHLLKVLKTEQLYAPFLCILKFLECKVVLETLETDKKLENPPCK